MCVCVCELWQAFTYKFGHLTDAFIQSMALDTYPVVSAHGIEAVGTTDEHQIIVSGNQYFDEVVALILKTDAQHVTT